MPRKKKLETTEAVTDAEVNDAETEVAVIAEQEIEAKRVEIAEAEKKSEEKAEKGKEEAEKEKKDSEEKADKKKKEKKKLSETELKRVMTDTKETLVPLTDYIACSVHLGTKVITPDMRKFVYKRRADGLAVLNTNLIDDKIREGVKFLNEFSAEDIFIACKREAGWPAVEKFAEVTGIRAFMKKYPSGIITNLRLENFFEPKLAVICDPWVDKNALNDANIIRIPVLGICDTNNYAKGMTHVMVGNNKSRKSVGLILFILAREYLKAQGKTKEAKALNMEDFTGKIEEMQSASHTEGKVYDAKPSAIDVAESVKEGV